MQRTRSTQARAGRLPWLQGSHSSGNRCQTRSRICLVTCAGTTQCRVGLSSGCHVERWWGGRQSHRAVWGQQQSPPPSPTPRQLNQQLLWSVRLHHPYWVYACFSAPPTPHPPSVRALKRHTDITSNAFSCKFGDDRILPVHQRMLWIHDSGLT